MKMNAQPYPLLRNGLAALLSLALASLACGRARPERTTEVGQTTTESPVKSITTIQENGGRLDWSAANDLIAFDRIGDGEYFQVYTMRPDGTDETCLTCGKAAAPTKHKGNPAWHPSGKYIVFQAEKEQHPGLSSVANPGFGIYNDLWLMTSDGQEYYPLTDVPEGMGVLHPHFSHDGSKLLWAERVALGKGGDTTGEWALKVADFVVQEGKPRLEAITAYQPLGPVFYESHDFSPDDKTILFTAHIEPDRETKSWLDIYTLDLATSKVERLTNTIAVWDEHAHYSPSGKKVTWMSSADCGCNPAVAKDLQTDIWMMNADGSDQARLTHFSDPNYPEFTGQRSVAADSSWNGDGTKLAVYVIEGYENSQLFGQGQLFKGRIVVIEFNSPQ